MSEHPEHGQHQAATDASDESFMETGNPAVDEVLRSLDGLQQRPVEEHVAVFEAAHEALRAALTDAGDRPSGPAGS